MLVLKENKMENEELNMEDRLRIRCDAYELQIKELKIQLEEQKNLANKYNAAMDSRLNNEERYDKIVAPFLK